MDRRQKGQRWGLAHIEIITGQCISCASKRPIEQTFRFRWTQETIACIDKGEMYNIRFRFMNLSRTLTGALGQRRGMALLMMKPPGAT